MTDSGSPVSTAGASFSDANTPQFTQSSFDDETYKRQNVQVNEILQSDIGVELLLRRLKSSIISGKDFTAFIKARSTLEEQYARDLTRNLKSARESIQKSDNRNDSFSRKFEQATNMNEQLAKQSFHYAGELSKMHDDLSDLCKSTERKRKELKQKAMHDEKTVTDAEHAAEKSKAKYYSLCEEFHTARTNDPTKRSGLKFKGSKTNQQVVEDLEKKVKIADQDYRDKVNAAKTAYSQLVKSHRPENIRALRNVLEMFDTGVVLRFEDYANLTERLALSNGLIISPMQPGVPGLKQIAKDIDSENDFLTLVLKSQGSSSLVHKGVEYVQHDYITNAFTANSNRATSRPIPPPSSPAVVAGAAAVTAGIKPSQPIPSSTTASTAPPRPGQPPLAQQQSSSSLRQQQPPTEMPRPPVQRYAGIPQTPPPQFEPPPQQRTPQAYIPAAVQQNQGLGLSSPSGRPLAPEANGHLPYPSTRSVSNEAGNYNYTATPGASRVFGVPLEILTEHDRLKLNAADVVAPTFVVKVVHAIEQFGLETKGLYTVPGASENIEYIQALFESADSLEVQLDSPAAFHNDIHALATVLKLYFQQLPDKLLTRPFYDEFVDAAKIPDDILRRDKLHLLVNDLPDANYMTLKFMIIHLNKVQEKYRMNNMTISTLASAWGTTFLGGDSSEAEAHSSIVNTILSNCYVIFDPD
ncbi:hypothetical protein POJ06DRAFT_255200 [Lipomyces tetrasporus]|uniref:RhoGAP-domain-containing protein n=1 Tax=Lipomyces tetrasporus TaxID=54092 RepID=A0AAD7QRM4_9ASCO|nr:uncharacterized protein POJ06DRAFT_255200 [Lipomyces tetrasporus]KAJ8100020.1 hypothetical protein POJ06DRAFT_255200 [Lipomyces tetrasporus]